MITEFEVVGRRKREYQGKNGKVVEHYLVLFERSACPCQHTLDWELRGDQQEQDFPVQSKIRLGITEIGLADFGRRVKLVGNPVK